jgi:hypothetical protein
MWWLSLIPLAIPSTSISPFHAVVLAGEWFLAQVGRMAFLFFASIVYF